MTDNELFVFASRIATQVRNEHTRNAHPYRAFPIDRLEAAVKAIPLEEFPVVERELAGFGSPHRFWCVAHVLSSLRIGSLLPCTLQILSTF